MKAVLTGSRAYGTPTSESDIDIVLLCTRPEGEMLAELADETIGYGTDYSCRFGKINLIVVFNELEFRAWEEGTKTLKQKAPVSKEEAKETFCQMLGVASGICLDLRTSNTLQGKILSRLIRNEEV